MYTYVYIYVNMKSVKLECHVSCIDTVRFLSYVKSALRECGCNVFQYPDCASDVYEDFRWISRRII